MSNIKPTIIYRVPSPIVQLGTKISRGNFILDDYNSKPYFLTDSAEETDSIALLISLGKLRPLGAGETPTGLELITEGNNSGWRLIGRNPVSFGNIGDNAVDFSNTDNEDGTGDYGATGEFSFAVGWNNKVRNSHSFVSGVKNVIESSLSGIIGGTRNIISVSADGAVILGGHDQTALQPNMTYLMGGKFYGYSNDEIDNLVLPEEGTLVWNNEIKEFVRYNGNEWNPIGGGGGISDDRLVAATTSAITSSVLENVLKAGNNIQITPISNGEALEISAVGDPFTDQYVAIDADHTPNYLINLVTHGDGLVVTTPPPTQPNGKITVDTRIKNFIDNDDTPSDYTGQAGKIVVVNSLENGVEFVDNPASETLQIKRIAFVGIKDKTKFVIPSATPGEILDTLLVTVGGAIQNRVDMLGNPDFQITDTNVERDSITFTKAPEANIEVIVEYLSGVGKINSASEDDIIHNDTLLRDDVNCHPISAITDLSDELNSKMNKITGDNNDILKYSTTNSKWEAKPFINNAGTGRILTSGSNASLPLEGLESLIYYNNSLYVLHQNNEIAGFIAASQEANTGTLLGSIGFIAVGRDDADGIAAGMVASIPDEWNTGNQSTELFFGVVKSNEKNRSDIIHLRKDGHAYVEPYYDVTKALKSAQLNIGGGLSTSFTRTSVDYTLDSSQNDMTILADDCTISLPDPILAANDGRIVIVKAVNIDGSEKSEVIINAPGTQPFYDVGAVAEIKLYLGEAVILQSHRISDTVGRWYVLNKHKPELNPYYFNDIVTNITVTAEDPAWQEVNRLEITGLPAGTYEFKLTIKFSFNSTSNSVFFRFSADGGTTWEDTSIEPKDRNDVRMVTYIMPTVLSAGNYTLLLEASKESSAEFIIEKSALILDGKI